ncbi:MAG: hypothetical protein IH631_00400, partial [Candidatus Thorarchaeota archaeon]|nr:hypothetical protein [Candidatus Thorarchaeota archaeon]
WDHRTDITYIDAEVGIGEKKETISLSILKPLVHHSRFFPDEFYVPSTCSELLSTIRGEKLTLTLQSEDSTFKSLRVKFSDDDLPAGSPLRTLENLELNIFALALLMECEQLIDCRTNTRHDFNIDAKALLGLSFSHIDKYPRLNEAISELSASDFDWTRDSWTLALEFRGPVKTEFVWSIISSSDGRPWLGESFTFILEPVNTLEEVLTAFKEQVGQTIPLENLENFEEQMERLESILLSRGWSDDPYSRIAQLEVTEKGVCVVVSQLTDDETQLEVDRLDITRDEIEDFASGFDEEFHPLTQYNIQNKDELGKALSMYLEGSYVDESGDDDAD